MYAIGYLENKQFERANALFKRSYANTHPPFYVWSEIPRGGGTNFITGAGGFIQGVINGYGGLRIRENDIIWNPELMDGTSLLQIDYMHYKGSFYNISIYPNRVHIFLTTGRLKITIDNNSYILEEGKGIDVPKRSFSISEPTLKNNLSKCRSKIKRDKI